MIHKFKASPNGKRVTECGIRYDVVCVNDDSKHRKQAGWCDSKESMIKAAKRNEGRETDKTGTV